MGRKGPIRSAESTAPPESEFFRKLERAEGAKCSAPDTENPVLIFSADLG
jgi:hypothetical protein